MMFNATFNNISVISWRFFHKDLFTFENMTFAKIMLINIHAYSSVIPPFIIFQ